MLNTAIRDNNAVMVSAIVDNMLVGLQQMVAEAKAAGYGPLDPDIWEAPLLDGRILRLVRSFPSSSCVPDNRDVILWTLEDVARMVEKQESINLIKQIFPGAEISDVRIKSDS